MEFESGLDPHEFVVREAPDVSMKAFFEEVRRLPAIDDNDFYPVDRDGRFDVVAYLDRIAA